MIGTMDPHTEAHTTQAAQASPLQVQRQPVDVAQIPTTVETVLEEVDEVAQIPTDNEANSPPTQAPPEVSTNQSNEPGTTQPFHPEANRHEADTAGTDKCYQLRFLINHFNKRAKAMRYVSVFLSFDEGGIGCRSRYCPKN